VKLSHHIKTNSSSTSQYTDTTLSSTATSQRRNITDEKTNKQMMDSRQHHSVSVSTAVRV